MAPHPISVDNAIIVPFVSSGNEELFVLAIVCLRPLCCRFLTFLSALNISNAHQQCSLVSVPKGRMAHHNKVIASQGCGRSGVDLRTVFIVSSSW